MTAIVRDRADLSLLRHREFYQNKKTAESPGGAKFNPVFWSGLFAFGALLVRS
jgi:hypothetical protein